MHEEKEIKVSIPDEHCSVRDDFDLDGNLKQKTTISELEKASRIYAKQDKWMYEHFGDVVMKAFFAGAKWQEKKDEITLRKFFNDRNQGDASFYDLLAYREGHRDGMEEQKEQMMKEAVEGIVSLQFADGTGAVRTTDGFVLNGLRCGQKVRIIIVKED